MSQAQTTSESEFNWLQTDKLAETDKLINTLESLNGVTNYEIKNNRKTIIITSSSDCEGYSFARYIVHHAGIINHGYAIHHVMNPENTDNGKPKVIISTINHIQELTLNK